MALISDICMVRLNNALVYPLNVRCQEIARLVDEYSSKELQNIFTILVADIFGITNQIGWGLRSIVKSYNQYDYNLVLEFFHPQGSFLRLCYKLMASNFNIKYDFPLSYLPRTIRSMIDDGRVPSFYSEFLKIDPLTGKPTALSLNPFEYYMFHFAYHLVNPCIQRNDVSLDVWDTAYLQLADDYLVYFLRCDGTVIPPVVGYFMTRSSTPLQTTNRPTRMPTVFRQSVLMTQNGTSTSLHSSPISSHQTSRMEIWRSELVAQVFLDFWLGWGERETKWTQGRGSPDRFYSSMGMSSLNQSSLSSTMADQSSHNMSSSFHYQQLSSTVGECSPYNVSPAFRYPQLPSTEHIRIVRNFLKHIHYFANSYVENGSAMDELKRLILPSSQKKIYNFLRRTIDQWPLDSSFRLVLETWLSFIQPWRYANYWAVNRSQNTSHTSLREDDQARTVDRRWLGFVAENLLAYTVVFRQLRDRFSRIDLTTPKNASMLFRITKIFSQPNLSSMIKEMESCLDETISSPSLHHKWTAIVRQHVLDVEGPGYVYTPMFGQQADNEMKRFLLIIREALRTAQELLRCEEAERTKNPTSFLGSVLNFLSGGPVEVGDYSLDDRRKVTCYLEVGIEQLSMVFGMEDFLRTLPDSRIEPNAGISLSSNIVSSPSTSELSMSYQQAVDGSMSTSLRDSPQAMKALGRHVKYEGDPDLEPIRSTENTFLVRMLYQITSKINDVYSEEMWQWHYRQDFLGRVARQFLQSPRIIRTYNKNITSHSSARVEAQLPPRLSLRSLASHRLLAYFFATLVVAYFCGIRPVWCTLLLVLGWLLCKIIAATSEQFLQMFQTNSSSSFPIGRTADDSMHDVSS